MGRLQQDRENLLTEAVKLGERGELEFGSDAESLVVGFRPCGSGSLFFGPDPAYHFNARDELRRAYVQGIRFKAEHGRWAVLTRVPSGNRLQLAAHDLTSDELAEFSAEFARRWQSLGEALALGNYRVVGQEPSGGDIVARLRSWLPRLALPLRIAEQPHAG